jgi:hypothetical protein
VAVLVAEAAEARGSEAAAPALVADLFRAADRSVVASAAAEA